MNYSVKSSLTTHRSKPAFRGVLSDGFWMRLLRKRMFRILERMEEGHLLISDADGKYQFGNSDAPPELTASLEVFDLHFYGAAALRGSVGAGESYMDGHWTCNDLTALVRVFSRNRRLLQSLDSGWTGLYRPLLRAYHRRRRNTRKGSRENISRHYDLGNEFFSLFLDDTMMYSCALFEADEMTLREASLAKLDRVCRLLQLSPSDHIMEIGSGWGGFAIHAAENYGCRVTTTTVSTKQYEFARRRVHEAGLSGRIKVLLQDYRDLRGTYDRIVSIEMIEAVGDEFMDLYFRKCARLLKPGGKLFIQAITIAPEFFVESRRNVDFIKRYIFPGSSLPSLASLSDSAQRTGILRLINKDAITEHYPKTLREWRRRFLANKPKIRQMGYSDSFIRMWDFYFCYCEGGFMERHIGDYQLLFERSGGPNG